MCHVLDIQNVDTGRSEQEINHAAWSYLSWLSNNHDRLMGVIDLAVLAARNMKHGWQRSGCHHCSDLQHRLGGEEESAGVDTIYIVVVVKRVKH
jgi:hypothetical protein